MAAQASDTPPTATEPTDPLLAAIRAALAKVNDPEIHRPITELGMVADLSAAAGHAHIGIRLTIAGCPLKHTLQRDITAALTQLPEIDSVEISWSVMTQQQRDELIASLRGARSARANHQFADPSDTTAIYAVASGKGGVGKSSITTNLAAALAAQGKEVGVLDADIYGFSLPAMLGISDPATKIDAMILPPSGHGVRLMSMGMFVPHHQPVAWRGPMLHRAIEQFLSDAHWGKLDVLLIDMPPGTGDVAISISQLLPQSQLLVVTTPQAAAAQAAQRAGAIVAQTQQRIVGVIENMAAMQLPDGYQLDVFGAGGGQRVADELSQLTGSTVPLLGSIPLDPILRADCDAGTPSVVAHPRTAASQALLAIATQLASRSASLVGRDLGLSAT